VAECVRGVRGVRGSEEERNSNRMRARARYRPTNRPLALVYYILGGIVKIDTMEWNRIEGYWDVEVASSESSDSVPEPSARSRTLRRRLVSVRWCEDFQPAAVVLVASAAEMGDGAPSNDVLGECDSCVLAASHDDDGDGANEDESGDARVGDVGIGGAIVAGGGGVRRVVALGTSGGDDCGSEAVSSESVELDGDERAFCRPGEDEPLEVALANANDRCAAVVRRNTSATEPLLTESHSSWSGSASSTAVPSL